MLKTIQLTKTLLDNKILWLVFLALFLVVLNILIYILLTLPSSHSAVACTIKQQLSMYDWFYSISFSALLALNLIGLVVSRSKTSLVGGSIITVIIGFLSTFCTICLLPAITFLGISINLAIFSTHYKVFNILALLLLVGSLIVIEFRLRKQCLLS